MVKSFINQNVLFEVGGGNCLISCELEKENIQTVMIEPGINGIHNARRRNLESLICSSFENAGFADNSLPNVGIFEVLQHFNCGKKNRI